MAKLLKAVDDAEMQKAQDIRDEVTSSQYKRPYSKSSLEMNLKKNLRDALMQYNFYPSYYLYCT